MAEFNPDILTPEDYNVFRQFVPRRPLGGYFKDPDIVIAPDGVPYIYRWYVVPRNPLANVYLHVQVADDPERPLHTHPWENTSVILSGGYDEVIQETPPYGRIVMHERRKGDVIHRPASAAHRLLLPEGVPYTMTLFTTGPKTAEWGFWRMPGGANPDSQPEFILARDVTHEVNGQSQWKEPTP